MSCDRDDDNSTTGLSYYSLEATVMKTPEPPLPPPVIFPPRPGTQLPVVIHL